MRNAKSKPSEEGLDGYRKQAGNCVDEPTVRAFDSSNGAEPVLGFDQLRRQVALHIIRFVLDTVCQKWKSMDPAEMDKNAALGRHGLDRRSYPHMEANILMACACADWLLSNSANPQTAASEALTTNQCPVEPWPFVQ